MIRRLAAQIIMSVDCTNARFVDPGYLSPQWYLRLVFWVTPRLDNGLHVVLSFGESGGTSDGIHHLGTCEEVQRCGLYQPNGCSCHLGAFSGKNPEFVPETRGECFACRYRAQAQRSCEGDEGLLECGALVDRKIADPIMAPYLVPSDLHRFHLEQRC